MYLLCFHGHILHCSGASTHPVHRVLVCFALRGHAEVEADSARVYKTNTPALRAISTPLRALFLPVPRCRAMRHRHRRNRRPHAALGPASITARGNSRFFQTLPWSQIAGLERAFIEVKKHLLCTQPIRFHPCPTDLPEPQKPRGRLPPSPLPKKKKK